ncbi:Fpg/Nei family DNA glycosylase [Angustibacter sp. McL0619]|uniref:Fpg/Nei family DNA glycosylase n=1 Tax=Angustibacter sp. McL0619 TaxID=3415676 RepID=UPI003CEB6F38
MPEGDVVARTAGRLHEALAGRVLIRSDLRWPSLATVDLTGRKVLEAVPRGKHLLLRLDGPPPLTLHSHLRMEGSWHLHRTGQPWRSPRSADGIRAILANEEWTAIGHQLGMLDLVPTADERSLVGHLGPDVLGADWDAPVVLAALAQQPTRAIGEALLDQRVLAGIGTIYMAESLFLHGTNPWTPAADVRAPDRLLDRVRTLMSANLERAAVSTTGETRHGRTTWVHGRARQPCRRCGTTIRVEPIGTAPHDRVAYYCPSCQPVPSGTC